MQELIRAIEGAGYKLTDSGYILKLNGEPFKPRLNNDGYDVVSVRLGGKNVQELRHRLIAAKYCERPIGCNVVNHKDGVKLNCEPANLEWCTQSTNILHAHGSDAYHKSTVTNKARARLLREQGLTLHEVAAELGASYVTIWRWTK